MNYVKDDYKLQAMFKRYCNNKDFECYSCKEKDGNGNFVSASVKIVSRYKKEYILTEYFKDNLTDYVVFKNGEKEYKFNRYTDAEISLVDALASEV